MPFYDLSAFDDSTLLQDGQLTAKRERGESASLLAYIAEIDARGLFVTAGCSSMFTYCLKYYRLSEDAANARIQVARTARKYPFLFEALQDGRLHITGVRLLAPHFTPENASELAAAATHRTMTEIQRLVAQRFPLEEPPKMRQTIRAIPSARVGVPVSRRVDPLFQELNEANGANGGRINGEHGVPPATPGASTPSVEPSSGAASSGAASAASASSTSLPGQPSGAAVPQPSLPAGLPSPLAPPAPRHFVPERYLLRFTVGRDTHDKLRYAQMLSSHSNPGGSIEPIMAEALDLWIAHKEKQRFAATTRPRQRAQSHRRGDAQASQQPDARAVRDPVSNQRHGAQNVTPAPSGAAPQPDPSPKTHVRSRYIHAEVRRAVWERDQGRCTFVSSSGDRCDSAEFVEFDHVDPVSRGGKSTVEGLRLLCRAHNQYEAELAFGGDFMSAKREEARANRQGQGSPEASPNPPHPPGPPRPGREDDPDSEAPPN